MVKLQKMRQIRVVISEETFKELVKKQGEKILETGKQISLSRVVGEILQEYFKRSRKKKHDEK
ncbi:MAG: hypothetical protein QXV73_04470 [Candidatus Micrarchaeia archaeon]